LQVAVKREIGGDRTSAYYVLAAAWVALMAISTPLWYFDSLILKYINQIMFLEKGLYNSFVLFGVFKRKTCYTFFEKIGMCIDSFTIIVQLFLTNKNIEIDFVCLLVQALVLVHHSSRRKR
jgi:hypothetical protein